jgi:hypothetical protein
MAASLAAQTAVYRGGTPAQSLQEFAADSQLARAAGYLPVSEEWSEDNGRAVLTVGYSRSTTPLTTPNWRAMPSATAPIPKRKRSRKFKIAAAIVVVFVGLAAIGSVLPDRSAAPSRADPATVDQGNAAVPEQADPAVASDSNRWTEFATWSAGELQAITVDQEAISAAADRSDVAGAMQAASNMEGTATRLLAYLANHPAAGCYSTVHSDITRALVAFREAGSAGSLGDFETATAELSRGTVLVETASTNIAAANAACKS